MDFRPIESTIVFILTPTEDSRTTLSPADFSDLLESPINVGQALSGDLIMTSVRAQLQILARRTRIEVKDLSGRPFEETAAASGITKVFSVVGGQVKTFGLNYHFEIPLNEGPSGPAIAKAFVSNKVLQQADSIEILTMTMRLTDQDINFQIQIEPGLHRPDVNTVFFNVNITEDVESDSNIEDPEWLGLRFSTGWMRTRGLVERLTEDLSYA